MFLAVIFYCTSPAIESCTMMANVENIWMTEQECKVDVVNMSNFLASKGAYARWACFKIGNNT